MTAQPRVTDNDSGEITVALDGKELRGWSYANDGERRQKMLQAREYVEGWCDGAAPRCEVQSGDAISDEQARYEASEPWPDTPLRCQCEACQRDQYPHASACAVHNGPAMPVGTCTCRPAQAAPACGESERLRKGIQDFLDGNYPGTRRHRPNPCSHGQYWYTGCERCDEEYLTQLLKGPELPSAHRGASHD
jgi:hypothetical protein